MTSRDTSKLKDQRAITSQEILLLFGSSGHSCPITRGHIAADDWCQMRTRTTSYIGPAGLGTVRVLIVKTKLVSSSLLGASLYQLESRDLHGVESLHL
jgi:hypothetical protein